MRATRSKTEAALAAFRALDVWCAASAQAIGTTEADIRRAEAWLRRFDLPLRTQDAIHIAAAQRLGATLATFDAGMARAAGALGVTLAEG